MILNWKSSLAASAPLIGVVYMIYADVFGAPRHVVPFLVGMIIYILAVIVAMYQQAKGTKR